MTKRIKKPETVAKPPWRTPAWTMEERLERIETMSQRILEYVRFTSQVRELKGISQEAREKAVERIYERMTVLESQLSRIVEELALG